MSKNMIVLHENLPKISECVGSVGTNKTGLKDPNSF